MLMHRGAGGGSRGLRGSHLSHGQVRGPRSGLGASPGALNFADVKMEMLLPSKQMLTRVVFMSLKLGAPKRGRRCRQTTHACVGSTWACRRRGHRWGFLTPGGREEEAEGPAEDLGQVRWKTREGKDLLGTAEWGRASSRRWVAESAAAGDRPDQDPESCGVGGAARLGTGLGTSLDCSVDLRVHNPHALCRAPWV